MIEEVFLVMYFLCIFIIFDVFGNFVLYNGDMKCFFYIRIILILYINDIRFDLYKNYIIFFI